MGLRKCCNNCGVHNTEKRKYLKRSKLTGNYWCKNCGKIISKVDYVYIKPENKHTTSWLLRDYNKSVA